VGPKKRLTLEYCVDEELKDLINRNAISSLLRAFVHCYELFKEGGVSYISEFSRRATLALYRSFTCSNVKPLLERASNYIRTLYEEMSKIFDAVFAIDIKLTSRLTIHTRNPFLPLDISLAWDPILNLPYIPSSSIKGTMRSWMESADIVSISGVSIKEVFGPSPGEESKYMGLVVLTDAYPISCIDHLIEPEVITPHYSYTKPAISEAESSPAPLLFPTIASGTVLRFITALNYMHSDKRVLNANTALKLIECILRALEDGIGAKTTIGYGRTKAMISHKTTH